MTGKNDDQVTEDGAVELDEGDLDTAAGGLHKGFEAWPSKWKVNGFDGKGNDVVTEEITFVTRNVFPKMD